MRYTLRSFDDPRCSEHAADLETISKLAQEHTKRIGTEFTVVDSIGGFEMDPVEDLNCPKYAFE